MSDEVRLADSDFKRRLAEDELEPGVGLFGERELDGQMIRSYWSAPKGIRPGVTIIDDSGGRWSARKLDGLPPIPIEALQAARASLDGYRARFERVGMGGISDVFDMLLAIGESACDAALEYKRESDTYREAIARSGQSKKDKPSHVYFMRSAETGMIKIGVSCHPKSRMKALQSASGATMTMLGVVRGDVRHEHELHKRFAGIRRAGEWFLPEQELLSYIETNASRLNS